MKKSKINIKIDLYKRVIKILEEKKMKERLFKVNCISMKKGGLSLREIGLELGCSHEKVRKILK